jgi:hypothetical protein
MLLALGILWLIFLGIFIVEVLRAPVGYEDKEGFHFAKSPQLPGVVRKPVKRVSRRGGHALSGR